MNRKQQIAAYIQHKKDIGTWRDENPIQETTAERAERMKQNFIKRKLRKVKRLERLKQKEEDRKRIKAELKQNI